MASTNIEPELLPCPFCGARPIYIKEHADYVACPKCETTGPNPSIVGGMNRVVEAWNTRVKSQ